MTERADKKRRVSIVGAIKDPPASPRLGSASTKAKSLSNGQGVTGGNRAAPAKNEKPMETEA